MLRMNDSSFNFNGYSEINETVIGSFSASYSGSDVYLNCNIADKTAYAANEAAFLQDLNSFVEQVMETVGNL